MGGVGWLNNVNAAAANRCVLSGSTRPSGAIKSIFKDRSYLIPVSSTKSMTGHLLGGSGGIEAVACILSLTHNFIP
ncbi:MAG: hypothetical protein JJ867_15075, partial [Marinobacter sp.]|nr:hypothetical protein [Marinobacter sp.]